MAPHLRCIVFAAALILTRGLGAESAQIPDFVSAYYEESEVCFNAPLPLDWRATADRHFTQFSLSQPDTALIRAGYNEIYGGTSSFPYSAPLPRDIATLHYHLFSETGVKEVRPDHLRGEVKYTLDHSGKILGPPDFRGQVCARVPSDIQDAGFVAVSARPQTWTTALARFDNREVPPRVRVDSHDLPVPGTKQTIPEIRAAYIARLRQGRSYLFVRRAEDVRCKRLCCTHGYDLYELGPHPSRVAWTAYNCDS